MKNYEDMAKDVLHRIDAYESDQRAKRAKIKKIAASVTPVCTATLVGVGLWKGGVLTSHNDQLINRLSESMASEIILPESNDISTDNHSASDKNDTNIGVEPAISSSTSDQQAENEDTIIHNATEENTSEKNITDTASVDVNTSASDNSNMSASDNTINKNNEPKRVEPSVQTETPVQQTAPPVQQSDLEVQSVPNNSGDSSDLDNWWCIMVSSIEWNGITFSDNDAANVSAYTQDKYIGKVGDFNGEYSTEFNYRISPEDSVYTVKESTDVLFVVKSDPNSPYGAIVVMCSPDWSPEKYEPERLEPNYTDSNESDDNSVVFNGFCQ